MNTLPSTDQALQQIVRAMQLANESCITLIRSEAHLLRSDGDRVWYDIRPMVDEREWRSESVALHAAAIQHALDAGLAVRAFQPHVIGLSKPRD